MFQRKHGLSTEPVPASVYVGSSKNLKDLKETMTVQGAVGICPASQGDSRGALGGLATRDFALLARTRSRQHSPSLRSFRF